ncbi:hypothetical protein EDB84DRAFT_713652 [Lactarius hengduanensis]|nr:hypothetical protein EDB84DRAFT_713652 [Lactarius hengduanensis]
MSPSKRTPLLVNDPLTLGMTFKTTTVKAQGQPSWRDSLKWLLFGSQLNTLLLSVPLATIADYLDWDPQLRFGFSLIAIVPLAKLQCDAAEQMSSYLRQTPRALLGTAFANSVELIVGLVALFHGQIRIVQTIMLGSVLSNFSFILTAFFVGVVISWPRNRACSCHPCAAGLKPHRCECKTRFTTQTKASVVSLAWITFMTPTAYSSAQSIGSPEPLNSEPRGYSLIVSHCAALFFLAQYIAYLVFQLKVPTTLFIARPTSWSSAGACPDEPFQDRKDTPEMSAAAASLALSVVTVLIYLAANSLVTSNVETGNTGGTLSSYIGLMLLPFLSKVSGHIASVGTNHTILFTAGLCVGNTLQITSFTFPFFVIVGWASGHELSLVYEKGWDIELHGSSLNCLSISRRHYSALDDH